MQTILELSHSVGFYGRLYRDLIDIKNTDEIAWSAVVETLESQNFKEPVDLILYLEQ